jgi:hypothetical protein
MQMLSLMFGGGQRSWIDAAFLICLFWIVLGKPERIQNFRMFRAACLAFAASIIAPPVITLILISMGSPGPGFGGGIRSGSGPFAEIFKYLSIVGPGLFVISFLMAIRSVSPIRGSSS